MNLAKAISSLGLACVCALLGCQDDATPSSPPLTWPQVDASPSSPVAPGLIDAGSNTGTIVTDAGSIAVPMPGIRRSGSQLLLEADPVTLQPGKEKYMCWTARTSEAVKVRSFLKEPHPAIHHVVLSTTTKPEPEGMRECDSTFQLSWRPLFATGAGKVELAFPPAVVSSIDKGTQLIVQLHLLNTADKPVVVSPKIVMALSEEANTQNVVFGTLGNTEVMIPAGQTGKVVAECPIPATTRVIGFFPHMHQLGTSMTLELGPTKASVQPVYQRVPYDFNDQKIDSMDMTVEKGTQARLTCSFRNTTSKTVMYGESSFDEMCYLIVFTVGPPLGCIVGPSPTGSGMGGDAGVPVGGDAGTSTTGCPPVVVMGYRLPGCCTAGMCGLDATEFGYGCQELGMAAMSAGSMGTMTADWPKPQACPAAASGGAGK